MRILFLDDSKERQRSFMMANIGHVIVQAWTAREAIAALESGERFDLASLDHDLDWQATAGLTPLEETGHVVARYIAAMPRDKRPRMVRVHSHNTVAGPAMLRTLLEAAVPAYGEPFKPQLSGAWIRRK